MIKIKIELKKINESDLEQIMHWRMKPSVTKFMNTDPHLTMEDQKKWFKSINESKTSRFWKIVADGVDIGVLGLIDIDYDNLRCCWQWYIGEEQYRGLGIAKQIQLNVYDYVFYNMNLHRLYNKILSVNKHVIQNVHEKCGYKVEGELIDHIYKNGQFYNMTIMGITKDMWESIKNKYSYDKIEFE